MHSTILNRDRIQDSLHSTQMGFPARVSPGTLTERRDPPPTVDSGWLLEFALTSMGILTACSPCL